MTMTDLPDLEERSALQLHETTELKQREADVQALKEQDLSYSEIAEMLSVEKSTVDEYSARINDRVERSRNTVQEIGGGVGE